MIYQQIGTTFPDNSRIVSNTKNGCAIYRETRRKMVKDIVIVGGGAAGWFAAAYLGKPLAAAAPGGARINLHA